MTQRTGIRHSSATPRVLSFLREHKDMEIPYAEISSGTGLPTSTISNSIGYLIQKGFPVTRPMAGVAILHSNRVPNKPTVQTTNLYEYVGRVDADKILLRDESGVLWVAALMSQFLKSHQ